MGTEKQHTCARACSLALPAVPRRAHLHTPLPSPTCSTTEAGCLAAFVLGCSPSTDPNPPLAQVLASNAESRQWVQGKGKAKRSQAWIQTCFLPCVPCKMGLVRGTVTELL